MAIKTMTIDQFLEFMRRQQGDQTDKEFAELIGVSPQYLCDVYMRRRIPGKSVAEALGVTRQLVYTINPKEEEG